MDLSDSEDDLEASAVVKKTKSAFQKEQVTIAQEDLSHNLNEVQRSTQQNRLANIREKMDQYQSFLNQDSNNENVPKVNPKDDTITKDNNIPNIPNEAAEDENIFKKVTENNPKQVEIQGNIKKTVSIESEHEENIPEGIGTYQGPNVPKVTSVNKKS